MILPRLLAHFARDAYVLCCYTGKPNGREFENAISDTAHLLGCFNRQGPGSLRLFGTRSASGCRHELDLGILEPDFLAIAEVKSRANGAYKSDVMIFMQKSFDYYLGRLKEGRKGPTWRLFISSTPLDESVHIYCIQQGVILIEPSLLPLPTLLRFVAQPEAEDIFGDTYLSEAVRLFEPACAPLEHIFVPDAGALRLETRRFFGSDTDDALWLAKQMTTDIHAYLRDCGKDPFLIRAKLLATSGIRVLSQSLLTSSTR